MLYIIMWPIPAGKKTQTTVAQKVLLYLMYDKC
jgi:hypothetical protein